VAAGLRLALLAAMFQIHYIPRLLIRKVRAMDVLAPCASECLRGAATFVRGRHACRALRGTACPARLRPVLRAWAYRFATRCNAGAFVVDPRHPQREHRNVEPSLGNTLTNFARWTCRP
jgi:hypothetical protein